jgi:hypothetical protein
VDTAGAVGTCVASDIDLHLLEEVRHDPGRGVPADRPECDVAQVEQAGIADHDIESEGTHRPDQGDVDLA